MNHDIFLVDDNPGMIQVMGRMLTQMGQVRFATSGDEALEQMRKQPPDVVLLDAEMPGKSGFDVCRDIKDDPRLRDIPVIFVTGHGGPEFEVTGFDVGAADFITKPVSAPLLTARIKTHLRVKHMTDELRRLARVDELTELANRACFDDSLGREWRRSLRAGHPLAVAVIEVDHFSQYVDRYGRARADDCLRELSGPLRDICTRPADLVARFDARQFALLLPVSTRVIAAQVVHKVLSSTEALDIAHALSPTSRHVTVSIGVGVYDGESDCWMGATGTSRFGGELGQGATAGDLVDSALHALRAAKAGGYGQAWLLDVGDAQEPSLAQEMLP